jgi:hypothetical protein
VQAETPQPHIRLRNLMPAYNARTVTTERQIIVAAEAAPDGLDFAQLDPMIAAAERELAEAGVKERPGVVLADASYWSNEHLDRLRERGITPLVAADADRRKGPRKTRLGGPYDFMRRVLASDKGADLYSRRQWMVEPCSPRSSRTGGPSGSNVGAGARFARNGV